MEVMEGFAKCSLVDFGTAEETFYVITYVRCRCAVGHDNQAMN
jgi:hypothetical protein